MRRVFVLASTLLLACESAPPPLDATLDSGIRVSIDERGTISLFDGERPLWAMPPGAFPTSKVFTERVTGTYALWTFRRSGEEVATFDRFRGARVEGAAVIAEYGADDGDATATLTIRPGARTGTTVIALAIDGAATSLSLPARCDADGSFHGFGEQYNATDQRGEAFDLIVSEQGIGREGGLRDIEGDEHTTYFPMPYYLDARGFGVLARTDHRVSVDVCATDPESAWIEVHDDAPLELVVFHGPTTLEVIRQLGDEVGRPKAPPDWAFGTWISSQGGLEVVRADVAALRANDIPVSAIWSQDWTGVRPNPLGGFGVQYRWNVDATHYPDLGAFVDELHAQGLRFLAYANPFVDANLPDHFPAMDAGDMLLRNAAGATYVFFAPNGMSAHPDFTVPASREYVQRELGEMVADLGIDGWMADFGEWAPIDAVPRDGTEPMAYHNRFPLDWHAVNRAAMDAARPDGDYVLFARSGWTGVQRHSMIHWIGDQEATWSEADGLPTVVPAMINLGLAGVPYVTHDIGGFSGGPSTKELYLRWTELGAFTPIMRTHEGNRRDVNHNWDTDAETIAHFRRFARIHEALREDLIEARAQAVATNVPMVRHLMLEFPTDASVRAVSDEYLLGADLLVAPVTERGATSREVVLPRGARWFHVWSGEVYEGGQTITVQAPIGAIPVFSRDVDRPDLRAIE